MWLRWKLKSGLREFCSALTIMKKILIILGPTGTGKSQLAVDMAQELGGEIINADSRQVYRDLQIGAAIPSDALLQKAPHHLLAHLSLNESWNAGIFEREATRLIAEIHSRQKLPIVVGGTGLYIRALLYGLCEAPIADEEFRREMDQQVQKGKLPELYEQLKKIDPASADKIHAHNKHRVIRALEVFHLTGKTLSQIQSEQPFESPRYEARKIGLTMERQALYTRLDQRVLEMISLGLEDEVRKLVESYGSHPILTKAIGYAEWFDYFQERRELAEVIAEIQKNTRHYAKRQMTWFGREAGVEWREIQR